MLKYAGTKCVCWNTLEQNIFVPFRFVSSIYFSLGDRLGTLASHQFECLFFLHWVYSEFHFITSKWNRARARKNNEVWIQLKQLAYTGFFHLIRNACRMLVVVNCMVCFRWISWNFIQPVKAVGNSAQTIICWKIYSAQSEHEQTTHKQHVAWRCSWRVLVSWAKGYTKRKDSGKTRAKRTHTVMRCTKLTWRAYNMAIEWSRIAIGWAGVCVRGKRAAASHIHTRTLVNWTMVCIVVTM